MIPKIATYTTLLAGLTSAGKCPFGYGAPAQQEAIMVKSEVKTETKWKYPSEILICPSTTAEALTTSAATFMKSNYEIVVKEVIALYDALPT